MECFKTQILCLDYYGQDWMILDPAQVTEFQDLSFSLGLHKMRIRDASWLLGVLIGVSIPARNTMTKMPFGKGRAYSLSTSTFLFTTKVVRTGTHS